MERAVSDREIREEMRRLLEEAERVVKEDPERAHRCAEAAWRIKLKHRADLPGRYRRSVCRRCHGFLMPGVTARVRLRRGRVVTRCLRCGATRRVVHGP